MTTASPLVAPPVTTVRGVVARLEAMQAHLDASAPAKERDGVAAFNHLYTVITKEVLRQIDRSTRTGGRGPLTDLEHRRRTVSPGTPP